MVIAIDFDDVLVQTGVPFLTHYNNTYGTNIAPRDLYSSDSSLWGVESLATAHRRFDEFALSQAYTSTPPPKDAIRGVKSLSRNHELHVITGRPMRLFDVTKNMIDTYYPDCFVGIECTSYFEKHAVSKSVVCKKRNVDVLIDDFSVHVAQVLNDGVDALLFGDYPWNAQDDSSLVAERAHNWHEVLKCIDSKCK